MNENGNIIFKVKCEDVTDTGVQCEETAEEFEFEILTPTDILDDRQLEIYKKISEIDKRIDLIDEQVEKLNSDIDLLTNHADICDYTFAVISGVIAGFIDSKYVGETELDMDKIQKLLENKYHTANDSGFKHKNPDGNCISSPMYHRLDDLAHHPSIPGLVASILVRYFRLVIFIDGSDGKPHIFFADTSGIKKALDKKEQTKAWIGAIIGGLCIWLSNMAIKRYEEINCGEIPEPLKKLIKIVGASPLMLEILKTVDIWVGHMMSDVATSQGIPGIFLSLLKYISVLPIIRKTDFRVWVDGLYNKGNMNLSEWGGVVFVAAKKQSLPVLINETLVRGFFFVKHLAEELKDKKDFKRVNWNSVLPFKNRTIVRMLTISTGTFMAYDVVEAAIQSGGFNAACILRINFVGVGRFAIAIGSDVKMGIEKGAKEKERMKLACEQLQLENAKVYYKQANMWIEAENTEKSMRELEEVMKNEVSYFISKWREIDYSWRGVDPNGMEIHNPELKKSLLS